MAGDINTQTLTQTGRTVGSDNVTTASTTNGKLIEWTVPQKFDEVQYRGSSHNTRFVPRTTESFSGDGVKTTFALSTDIVPIAGEETIADQPYPVVQAYNVTAGSEPSIESIDYSTNEVTLSAAPASGDTVKFWPVLTDGMIKYHIIDQFDHDQGVLEDWGVGLFNFADFNTYKESTRIQVPGNADLHEHERLALFVEDAAQAVTWTDADYPFGSYVTTIEQDVTVRLK